MAYNIERSDTTNNTAIVVADSGFNNTDTSLSLVGRNATNYGDAIATTQVHMLENFANSIAPPNPIQGQLWYDNNAEALKLNVALDQAAAIWATLAVTGTGGGNQDLGAEGDAYGTLFVDTIGSLTTPVSDIYGGTFHGTATQAQYADLAERFAADAEYAPGTIVRLGGECEITQTLESLDNNVLGVIAENPAFMMNTEAGNDVTHPYVAMAGRVQVSVSGTCKKGDRITSFNGEGIGYAPNDKPDSYCVIGRALEDKTTNDISKVWIVVGAK